MLSYFLGCASYHDGPLPDCPFRYKFRCGIGSFAANRSATDRSAALKPKAAPSTGSANVPARRSSQLLAAVRASFK
jgi:hypothetical protein